MGQSRETTELQWHFPHFFCWQWLPRLRLTLTSCTEDTMAMASATAMDTDTPMEAITTARGRLRLNPRPRLTLTSCTADTTAMDSATYGYGYPYRYGYYGKREAEAEPAVVAPVVGYPYAAYPYAAPAVVPATQSITYKTYTPTAGEPIVKEHTAVVPTLAYYGKREAEAAPEAKADP